MSHTSPDSSAEAVSLNVSGGYTKREDMALRILIAMLESPNVTGSFTEIADAAVRTADALIKRLNE